MGTDKWAKEGRLTGINHYKKLEGETEWERVQRMRKEEHPLIQGGQYKETPYFNDINVGSCVKRNKL